MIGRSTTLAGIAILALAGAGWADTAIQPYAVAIDPGYSTDAILSVGDIVPETANPSQGYKMVGFPDGTGATTGPDGTVSLFTNHEFGRSVQSEPNVGGPLQRGSFVSHWTLGSDGNVVSGERAYDSVFNENTYVGPAAQADNSTSAFSRLCAGNLAGEAEGYDRPIYFAGEEAGGSDTFDGKGGVGVAFFDNEAHALPKLGHFAKENLLTMPKTGNRTVIIPTEDGPSGTESQLYMYVGKKDHSKDAGALARNGLDNGALYVFVSETPGMTSETSFQSGTIKGSWVEIPNADQLTDTELEAASDAVGAFGFVRIEDGAFSPKHKGEFYFVTTGGSTGNELGRLYTMKMHPDPKAKVELNVVYNADQVTASGGDIAVSPDNIAVSDDYLMVQEDGTTQSRAFMSSKGRDGSIWRFDIEGGDWKQRIDAASALRIVELDPPGRDGAPVGPGVWESSGIIDASAWLGEGTWIFDVQAHAPTTAPAPNTVEDGQLLILRLIP